MALKKGIKEFALTKAIKATAYDIQTGKVIASTKNTKTLTISDETPVDYLVGGENLAKLIPVVGQQDAKVTFTTATTSNGWLGLQLNTTVKENATFDFDTDDTFTVESGEIEIDGLKDVSSVFTTDEDADNRDDVELTKIVEVAEHYERDDAGALEVVESSATDGQVNKDDVIGDIPDIQAGEKVNLIPAKIVGAGEYAITGNKIKVVTDLNDKDLHIFYKKEATGSTYKSKGGQGKTVRLVVTGLAIDPSTQIPYLVNVVAPKAKVTQSVTQESKNDGVPNDLTFEFSALYSNKDKSSYEVYYAERSDIEGEEV